VVIGHIICQVVNSWTGLVLWWLPFSYCDRLQSFFYKNLSLVSFSFMVPDVNHAHSKLWELENGWLSDWYCIATETGCIVSNHIGFCKFCSVGENPVSRASLQVRQLVIGRITQDDQRAFVPHHLPCVNAVWSSTMQEGVGGACGGKRMWPYTSLPVTSRGHSTTGCGKKNNPLRFLAVFSAISWNFKAKFYGHI